MGINGVILFPRGTISVDISGCHTGGGDATGLWEGEARDTAKRSAVHKASPQAAKDQSTPNAMPKHQN